MTKDDSMIKMIEYLCVFLCVCVFMCTGEFGSVREAFLKLDDASVEKVAVKVLKCGWSVFFCGICRSG